MLAWRKLARLHGGLCSEAGGPVGTEVLWCAALLDAAPAAPQQPAGVFQTAILPLGFSAFSGCGRGLPSCQVCWLDSEENLFSPHITNDDPRGVGAVGRWPQPPKPIYKNKTSHCSEGLNGMARRRGVHANELSSSICPAHLNFNNSLLKELLSLNVWMSLTRAQWGCW